MRTDRVNKRQRAVELDAAGLDHLVIAARLGSSPSAVKEMLKRAKRDAAVTNP